MSLVLDASMTISWLFEDERTDAGDAILARVAREGAVVPNLWRLEVANMLRTAVRRGRCNLNYAESALARLQRLSIAVDEETDRLAWSATWTLSKAHDLTLYDAAYLELADRKKLPIASLDGDLLAAAASLALETLPADMRTA